MDSALQSSIDSLLTEGQEESTDPTADEQHQQAAVSHWLPSPTNSYTPALIPKIVIKIPRDVYMLIYRIK